MRTYQEDANSFFGLESVHTFQWICLILIQQQVLRRHLSLDLARLYYQP